RAARTEAPSHPHSIAALVRAERWPPGSARISRPTSARFPFRDRVPPSRLASAADDSSPRKTSRLLDLGRHDGAERTQSRTLRIPPAHDRLSLSALARRLFHEVRS